MRDKFETRTIRLVGSNQLNTALALLPNLPLDSEKPLVVTIGEEAKPRGLDANALMWVGPLADIAAQGWVGGHQMNAKTWHEIFKEAYLPEAFDEELTKKGYEKWGYKPNGDRVLIGSTTELTVKGFALYLEQVYADGASIGVEFKANPNDARRAA